MISYSTYPRDFIAQKAVGYCYGFNGMERDDEVAGSGNSYTTHFRQYDPRLGRWMSVDPEAASFYWQSPYISMDDNPILLSDPLGDSTFVTKTKKGTYKVIGGNLDGDDNGIYIKNADGTVGDMIGYSATPESFFHSESGNWYGEINTKDQSGKNFLEQLQKDNPGPTKYALNANNGKKIRFQKDKRNRQKLYY